MRSKSTLYKIIIISSLSVLLGSNVALAQKKKKALKLEAYTKIDKDYSKETSGIVQSRKNKGVFWILDDSGNDDMIYAIDIDGEAASGKKKYKGQKIKGAKNKDWEDILTDDAGNIIIADTGNNCECRDDLRFIFVEETDVKEDENKVVKEIPIKYPVLRGVLGFSTSDFDSEASFFLDGHIYVLTKHRPMFGIGKTKLFRLDSEHQDKVNELTHIGDYTIDGAVTGADINEDGTKLAILTYNSIWVYDIEPGKGLLGGQAYRRSIRAHQVESIAFYKDRLIIVDEKEGRMYKVKLSELERVD